MNKPPINKYDYLKKRPILKLLYNLYTIIFPNYEKQLKKIITKNKTLLDVGCGDHSPIHLFSKNIYSVGIDCWQPAILKSKRLRIHNKYVKINALEVRKHFKPKEFDIVLASDLIEHLTKKEGLKLIKMMEEVAIEKVIILTPNGFIRQDPYKNPYQEHKSGWVVKDFEKLGYDVTGVNGWKSLRKEYSLCKYKPYFLGLLISDITQIYTKYFPEKASHLLAIKEIEVIK